uniref:FAD-binding PCMH-type domain-containing protein n=2 Tax=Aegilops tauschii subsp. strangulata TaxID=200361 RepID=A0A453SES7_AEGTS
HKDHCTKQAMASSRSLALALLFSLLSCYASVPSLASSDGFLQCLSAAIPKQLLYTQSSPSFTSVLVSSIRNPKFSTPGTVRPLCIVTPTNASHVQAAVVCGRRNDVRVRVRSGGHDYEGLSYRSARPEVFAVVDLANLRSVRVDQKAATAWVDSGATLGELYYAISKASRLLAFPAGLCPTIGVGGHFSGGGFGMLLRKYGVAIDNVLDATLVDANGKLLDKQAMGTDVFWAIRGGGGESFGIVLSWKVKLVPVPPAVTMFSVTKSVDEGAVDILTRWQEVAPALPEDHQGARAEAGGQLRVHVPGDARHAAAADAQPLPGARPEPDALQGDDLDPVCAVHLPGQRRHRGGHPEPDHRHEVLQQGHVRLRPSGHPQGRVGEDFRLARQAGRRADDHGPLRREDRQPAGFGDAVPAPRWGAVQHPVHEFLVGRHGRIGSDEVAQRFLRVHGAVREQQPQGGVCEL